MLTSFKHCGDLGDIVYSLPTIRAAGGGALFLAQADFTRVKTSEQTLRTIAPLIEVQPYVRGVSLYDGRTVAYELDLFRGAGSVWDHIAHRHLMAFGFPREEANTQWITVPPEPIMPVVINRTDRFQNAAFPWKEVVRRYGQEAVFVGTEVEHQAFVAQFGDVPYWPTENLLELAKVIAGAWLFIGNQSCPLAIAEALKKPIIQETCLSLPNCRMPRDGFQAVAGARVDWPTVPAWIRYGLRLQARYIAKLTATQDLSHNPAEGAGKEVHKKQAPKATVCIVQHGRYGDILNILPIAKALADEGNLVAMLVNHRYADLLESVSYVAPVVDHSGEFEEPLEAANRIGSMFDKVLVPQVYDRTTKRERLCESFNEESWRYAGWLDKWDELKLVLDRRSAEREQKLLEAYNLTNKPFILYNGKGFSSPFQNAEQLEYELRKRWAEKVTIVDLARVKAERFYDLLGLMDKALALVTIDTATLHLASASNVPVVALVADDWNGSRPRCNCVLKLRYQEYPSRLGDIHATIERLVSQNESMSFFHSGDLGDIVYALLFMSTFQKPRLFVGPEAGVGTRITMNRTSFEWILPLLESQGWLGGVAYAESKPSTNFNLNEFRKTWFNPRRQCRTLAQCYPEHFRRPALREDVPWLSVQPKPVEGKPVVIARSERYRNPSFPWRQVSAKYKGRMLFVGLRSEYDEWCSIYGNTAEYYPVQNALEMAQIIAGAKLFIGNQSFPMSLAIALNVPVIQETSTATPDCVFKRPNAVYSHLSKPTLPDMPGEPIIEVQAQATTTASTAVKYRGRLSLPITLLAIDTFAPNITLNALVACRREVTFKRVVMVCRRGVSLVLGDRDGIHPEPVDVSNDRVEREKLLIFHMHEFFDTSHCLHVEHDARIANPLAWRDEWLQYDFIGAPWPYPYDEDGFPPCNATNCVGNYGFALISRRFCKAVASVAQPTDREARISDAYICRTLRPALEDLGIKFAPEEVAERFSCENRYYSGQFGWHGRGTAALNGFKVQVIASNTPVSL